MSVLIQMCFIHIVGGYVNVAQISRVQNESVYVVGTPGGVLTGDKTPEDFLKRVEETCGGKSR